MLIPEVIVEYKVIQAKASPNPVAMEGWELRAVLPAPSRSPYEYFDAVLVFVKVEDKRDGIARSELAYERAWCRSLEDELRKRDAQLADARRKLRSYYIRFGELGPAPEAQAKDGCQCAKCRAGL